MGGGDINQKHITVRVTLRWRWKRATKQHTFAGFKNFITMKGLTSELVLLYFLHLEHRLLPFLMYSDSFAGPKV